ncbi:MAG TPA: efflux RND transporter periplasmic adaptor subunit, partial [Candidatus Contendobacter sp.]|nr:efflux RND transporter periplasmic adaptor subunit [Candidatus Contendobacter sp.]
MNDTTSVTDPQLAKIIQAKPARGRFKVLRWLVALALLAGLAAGGWAYFHSRAETQAAPQYQTEPLGRGNLRVTVSATGKLEPINQVDVGSELSGTIETVLVDDNDRV